VATVCDRKFSLEDLRRTFGAARVFNVYSKKEITRDQTKDQVQSVMRAVSENKALADRSLTELRREATKIFAECIVEREQIDPLISVSGGFRFGAMPQSHYADFSDVVIESDERSRQWIEECVEKKLYGFRYSETVTTKLSGDMRFVLE
jgi:hypothetical protein